VSKSIETSRIDLKRTVSNSIRTFFPVLSLFPTAAPGGEMNNYYY
jgi:hypothetical protein